MDSDESDEVNWPDLPVHPNYGWSANVLYAYEMLDGFVAHSIRLLEQDDADPVQVTYYADTLEHQALPLLEALENSGEALPLTWLGECAAYLGKLAVALQLAQSSTNQRFIDVLRL